MPTRFTSLGVKGALTVAGLATLATAVVTTLTVTTGTFTTLITTGSFTGSGTFRAGQLSSGTGVFLNDLLVTRNSEAATLSGATKLTISSGHAVKNKPLCIATGGVVGVCTTATTPCSCVSF